MESDQAWPPSDPPASPLRSNTDEQNVDGEEDSAGSPTSPSEQLDPSMVEPSAVRSEVEPKSKGSVQDSKEANNDGWIDVLGSGELLKKVSKQLCIHVALVLHACITLLVQ